MPLYRLHTTGLSPYGQRVCLTLDLKGLTGETELVETYGGTDALKALAPMAQIPVLEGPDGVVPESQVIVEYLDSKHAEPALRAENPTILAQQSLLARIIDLYIAPHTIALITAMRGVLSPAAIGEAQKLHMRGFQFVEAYLDNESFAVGEEVSIADIAIGPFLFYAPQLASWHDIDDPLVDLPKSRALLKHLQAHPVFAKVFENMDRAFTKRSEQFAPN